ncbi:serine/threonine-protein kinase [Streptomyces sp. NBC_01142]|uniref:serine/threonine-protein kinase n=1 Tax=Streptomyces sp. NBC_01142 TaxID=2975865 RepID=UPI00225A1B11|nr:serine/threonine-protein kinase [Streptomyces sp. NBC_01142]MCX4823441.1 serine/threonine-protein kinase [Streptomyces sp. NBC_01142]
MLSPLTHDDPAEIGAYRLTARLGSGGMGTVYLARSAGGRTVALKTMHAAIASDPASRTRFRLETDAARIIGGHHGATVVDADPISETPWLATEYVLGPPLDDAITLSGPLPETSVRALGAALAGALAQLHASDVVHRDLKPSNVMITAYGPKIIDFGIAHAAGDDRLTRTGAAAGTPAFMSPEQATGQEHTPAGDVFALAGVLVFAATGHGPFGTGQPADLIYRVRYADPDLTGLPDTLTPLLTRCLAKDPTHRPTTTELTSQLHDGHGQFADHLPDTLLAEIARRAAEVWQHQPHRLPAPTDFTLASTTPDAAPSGMSRRKLLAISGGSALAAVAAGAGGWSWFKNPGGQATGADTKPSTPSAADLSPTDPSTTPADKRQVWAKSVKSSGLQLTPMPVGDTAVLMTDEGLLGLAALSGERRWLVDTVKQPRHVHSDGKQIYALLPGGSHGHQLSLHTVDPVGGRTSPSVSFGTFDKPLQQAALLHVADNAVYLAARKGSPNDSSQVKAASWCVLAVSRRTGEELWSEPIRSYDFEAPGDVILAALAGKRLILCRKATSSNDLEVSARDARSGAQLWKATVAKGSDDSSPLTPGGLALDDKHVYFGSGRIQAFRLTDGSIAWTFGEGSGPRRYGTPAVRDGKVYAAEKDKGIVVVDAGDGELRWIAETGDSPDLRIPPVVNKDYAFCMAATSVRAVELAKRSQAWSFTPHSSSLALHASAKRLIMSDGKQARAIRLDITF